MPTKRTEAKKEVLQEIKPADNETLNQDPANLQTDTETHPDEQPPSLKKDIATNSGSVAQIDSERKDATGIVHEEDLDTQTNPQIAQTEAEAEKTSVEDVRPARRTRKTKPKQTESDTVIDKTTENGSGQEDPPAPLKRKRSSVRPSPVVAIGERLGIETEAERARSDLLDLVESLKSKRILTGTIQGIERPIDNPSRSLAVIYHGDYKIIIPAEEAVELPSETRGRSKDEVYHYLITKRLGAEVDFIVKGIDNEAGLVVGSRLEAMAQKRREYYFGTDRDGNNLLYEGSCAEARVVSVIRAGIFVDLFGQEVYIPLRELSYQRMMDAGTGFQPGQRILVKIINIDRSDRANLKVAASVKQAGENPYEKALRRYTVGNRYVGTVNMVDTTGVFVALDGGIDCLCSYPKRGRPPRGARVTVRILGINHDTNRIWGAITHISVPR